MLDYNTRGTKHSSSRKEFDAMYNKGCAWTELFDVMVKDSLSKTKKVTLSQHAKSQIQNNREGNRVMTVDEISRTTLMSGEVVEVEFQTEIYESQDFNCLKKAVIRLPERTDGEQVVAVCQFDYDGTVFVRTAWLNKANDNHTVGLDTSEFDSDLNHMFGYFHRNWTSRVWAYANAMVRELTPNVAITWEEYDRRGGWPF